MISYIGKTFIENNSKFIVEKNIKRRYGINKDLFVIRRIDSKRTPIRSIKTKIELDTIIYGDLFE